MRPYPNRPPRQPIIIRLALPPAAVVLILIRYLSQQAFGAVGPPRGKVVAAQALHTDNRAGRAATARLSSRSASPSPSNSTASYPPRRSHRQARTAGFSAGSRRRQSACPGSRRCPYPETMPDCLWRRRPRAGACARLGCRHTQDRVPRGATRYRLLSPVGPGKALAQHRQPRAPPLGAGRTVRGSEGVAVQRPTALGPVPDSLGRRKAERPPRRQRYSG